MIIQKKLISVNFSTAINQRLGICIHTMVGTLDGTDSWFHNPEAQVSSHYGVDLTTDKIYQWVEEKHTAWAQGRVSNPTNKLVKEKGGNPNSYFISIECADNGNPNGAERDRQIITIAELVRMIAKGNNIPLNRDYICGHREIYDKKTCPGNLDLDKIINLAKGNTMSDDEIVIKKSEYEQLLEAKSYYQQFKDNGFTSATEVKQRIDDLNKAIEDKNKEIVSEKERAEAFRKDFNDLLAYVAKALNTQQELNQVHTSLDKLEGELTELDDLKRNFASLQLSSGQTEEELKAEIAKLQGLLKQQNVLENVELSELVRELVRRLLVIVKRK